MVLKMITVDGVSPTSVVYGVWDCGRWTWLHYFSVQFRLMRSSLRAIRMNFFIKLGGVDF